MSGHLTHYPRFVRLGFSAFVFALLLGCGPSRAGGDAEAAQEALPSQEELRKALHPEYVLSPGGRQECLGRVAFEASHEMEWAISKPGMWSGDRFRFTKDMGGEADYVLLGNVNIVILAPANWMNLENMRDEVEASKDNAIHEYRNQIKVIKRIEADRKERLKNLNGEFTQEDLESIAAVIERDKNEASEIESRIAGLERDWHSLDLGLPDSLGYAAGPTLYAFLLRNGRAFQFMATGGEGAPPFETRKTAFLDMLKRFQTRELYEVPQALGICIPYGFIPDDGKGHFRTEVSFRYKDRPGVIYSLGTAVVGEQNYLGESAFLTATARSAGALGSGLVGGREAKAIAPHRVMIGALEAWQGGVSLNVADRDKPPVRSYSVYTGYDGYAHSRVLPGIRVNLRSFTREQEDSLTADPPPLEESLQRLNALLKSIRLRPTVPEMPEILEAAGHKPS